MHKKNLYYSLLIIPIMLFILLINLYYFTDLWKPKPLNWLIIILILMLVAVFTFYFIKNSYQEFNKVENNDFTHNIKQRFWKLGIIGFIADFFDTIGIGSFAVSMVLLKFTKQVHNDKKIMGIINVGHTIPTCLEAIIFIALIPVAWTTLIPLIIAGTVGGQVGAILANKIKLNWSRLFIGLVLLIVAIIMLLAQEPISIMPEAGDLTGFNIWWKYLVGVFSFFILGILMSLGIGIFAPAMAIIYLLGLHAECAFPIMMGTAAFSMPTSAIRFIKNNNYEFKPAFAFSLAGSIGVICGYSFFQLFLKKGLKLDHEQFKYVLLWIVIVVIFYTAISLIITTVKGLRYNYREKTTKVIINN